MGRRTGWASLVEWSLAFALLALVVVSAASIGMFLIPVAMAAVATVGQRNRAWPYVPFGACLGVGALVTIVGLMHLRDVPCPTTGFAMRVAAGAHYRCGGFNPRPWLAIGGILSVVGLAGYLALGRTRRVAKSTAAGEWP